MREAAGRQHDAFARDDRPAARMHPKSCTPPTASSSTNKPFDSGAEQNLDVSRRAATRRAAPPAHCPDAASFPVGREAVAAHKSTQDGSIARSNATSVRYWRRWGISSRFTIIPPNKVNSGSGGRNRLKLSPSLAPSKRQARARAAGRGPRPFRIVIGIGLHRLQPDLACWLQDIRPLPDRAPERYRASRHFRVRERCCRDRRRHRQALSVMPACFI